LVIAGYHGHPHAHVFKHRRRRAACGFYRIGNGYHAKQFAFLGKHHRRFALRGELVDNRRHLHPVFLH
jgi:hypothetical protein